MRVPVLLPVAVGAVATLLFAAFSPSGATQFDIKGTWAAEGKACSEAGLFVEFDGRDILAYKNRADKSRVAADYSAAYKDGLLTVSLVNVASKQGDEWTFSVQDENAMRMDNSLFTASGAQLMKLTRCSSAAPERIAAH